MKRLGMYLTLKLCFVLAVVTLFSGCGNIYEHYEKDGFHFTVFPGTGKGVVDYWQWDGEKGHMVITIPETVNGYRITQLGGRIGYGLPSDFVVHLPRDWHTIEIDDHYLEMESPYNVVELDFTINISRNITKIEMEIPILYYKQKERNEDGSYTYYRAYAYVNCSEENPVFYSENGRLYYRETGKLVNKFLYR